MKNWQHSCAQQSNIYSAPQTFDNNKKSNLHELISREFAITSMSNAFITNSSYDRARNNESFCKYYVQRIWSCFDEDKRISKAEEECQAARAWSDYLDDVSFLGSSSLCHWHIVPFRYSAMKRQIHLYTWSHIIVNNLRICGYYYNFYYKRFCQFLYRKDFQI